MEKYFKPVHGPVSPEEKRNRRHHHQSQSQHYYDSHSQRYTDNEDSDRNTDDNLRHRYNLNFQDDYHVDGPRQHQKQQQQQQQHRRTQNSEMMYDQGGHMAPHRTSSSSISSSSSLSSYSSWYTETSAIDPFPTHHAERPQHSLSCSNIAAGQRMLRDDEGSKPIVFATVRHGSDVRSGESNKQRGRPVMSTLERGHSRSSECLQGKDGFEGSGKPDFGPLYKTSSLNRSLAFSEEDIVLEVSRGPKRAVSSMLLPGKGILKNKTPSGDIRKARSMEVLSPRVAKDETAKGPNPEVNKQAEIEHAREHFLQGKLRFSAFLDEITKQVISPSSLTMLGVNNNQPATQGQPAAPAPPADPVKPQLPTKKNSRNKRDKDQSRPELQTGSRAQEKMNCSESDKMISYAASHHQGSPPPQCVPKSNSKNANHGKQRGEKRPSPLGSSMSGDRHGRFGPHLTDGHRTSPETIKPRQRPQNKQQDSPAHGTYPQHLPQAPQGRATLSQQGSGTSSSFSSEGAGIGLGSESSSSKSDSSRNKDKSSKGTSTEKGGIDSQQRAETSKQHWETAYEINHLKALQEENSDLQQNLLQTVVCIESLETELQRTRDELGSVKEKYKSLLETHTGTKQANNILGEHLHIASESLNNERRFLLNQVSQLSSQLEDAHKTIAALENINVPCLIKELLEKHCHSTGTLQKFKMMSAPNNHSAAPNVNGEAHKCLPKSEPGPQRATAFMPFRQPPSAKSQDGLPWPPESNHNPPFSVADMSDAIYENITARPQPVYPKTAKYYDPSKGPQVFGEHPSLAGGDDIKVSLLEEDVVPLTPVSAQNLLEEFMQQLQAHKASGGGTELGLEWAGGVEPAGSDRQLRLTPQHESI